VPADNHNTSPSVLPPDFEHLLTRSVGSHVRIERNRRGLTLQDVAKRSGLSIGMLSKVENGQISPSLKTLGRLSRALDVPVTTFFRDIDEEHDASFVKSGQGIAVASPGAHPGHRYELLTAPFEQRRRMEAWLVTLPSNEEAFPLFQHGGSEFIYVLEGRVVWQFGRQRFDMEPGDALLLDASIPHGPEEVPVQPARYLAIEVGDEPNHR
jgi:transcriptional regulator with XRE-family HTH domain